MNSGPGAKKGPRLNHHDFRPGNDIIIMMIMIIMMIFGPGINLELGNEHFIVFRTELVSLTVTKPPCQVQ